LNPPSLDVIFLDVLSFFRGMKQHVLLKAKNRVALKEHQHRFWLLYKIIQKSVQKYLK